MAINFKKAASAPCPSLDPEGREKYPYLAEFLYGGTEVEVDGKKVSRDTGSLTIGWELKNGHYRITLREKTLGLVAFYNCDSLDKIFDDIDAAIGREEVNWTVDKYAKKK